MRVFACGWLVAAAVGAAPAVWADDEPTSGEPLPSAPFAADVVPEAVSPPDTPPRAANDAERAEPATPAAPPSVPAELPTQEPAADGTTSVVVPADPPGSTAGNPTTPPLGAAPPLGPPPFGQPATAPAPPLPPPSPPPAITAPPPGQPAPQNEASLLLMRLLEPMPISPGRPTTDQAIYTRPMTLLEPLVRSGDRSRRLWIVQAYWKVSVAYAAVRCGTEALERLEFVAPGADPHDRATLDVASAAARADLAEARALLGVAQQELVDLARLPVGEALPWPVDRPLADPYQTQFEAIFANRIATGRVRAIVRSLPARYEALAARAAAVLAAEKAMAMAEADHAKGNRPIEAVIAAHAALVGQQDSFLEAVRTYNLEIAEYAMAVAELSLPDDQFVSMLIGTPIQWRPPADQPLGAAGPLTSPPAVVTAPGLSPANALPAE